MPTHKTSGDCTGPCNRGPLIPGPSRQLVASMCGERCLGTNKMTCRFSRVPCTQSVQRQECLRVSGFVVRASRLTSPGPAEILLTEQMSS